MDSSKTPRRKPSRPAPSQDLLDWREAHLKDLGLLRRPSAGDTDQIPRGLEQGNSKTGISGEFYDNVFVWSLPAVATCPGASAWCKRFCYNADPRAEKFPLRAWSDNWASVEEHSEILAARILEQLRATLGRTAVRIHSSGDFFSIDYVRFWLAIASQEPTVAFWAYTRSWAVPSLLPWLEELRSLTNVQLFASWDRTMPPPPPTWRLSLVAFGATEPVYRNQPALQCPEEYGAAESCASCGYCIREGTGDVLFSAH